MLSFVIGSRLRREHRCTPLKSAAKCLSTSRMVLLIAAMVSVSSVGARADVVEAAGHLFFITMEKRYAGKDRHYERSGNSLTTTHGSNDEIFVERVTRMDRCTYQFDFIRPPTVKTLSTSMQIDFSGFKRANMTQSVAGRHGDAAVKVTGIRACNVGQHSEFWNTHIAPGTCSATFFRRIGDRPELQRAGLNEMIAHCKGGG